MAKTRDRLTLDQVQRELADTAGTLPIWSLMGELFVDPKMFKSYSRFEKAGFSLVDHSPHKIMTGSHKLARGYFFKKYDDDKPGEKQLRNYMHRVEGSRLLRPFIAEHGFTRVVAPRKWLYELPSSFPERYLVVAEKIDLVSRSATDRAYARISREQMRELATVLYYFRGLNSTAANLPYTKDDKIAFVDTERWHHDKDYLRRVGDRLSADRRALADEVYEDLRRQRARPFVSAFK
jgi:hypothetical protein